ncbi:MAG: DUF4124 domain-containing protein [Burkholderiaceae bacterium]
MKTIRSLYSSTIRAAVISQVAWAAVAPLSAQAEVYKHVAPDGTVTFSDTPPLSTPAQTLRQPTHTAPTAPTTARSAATGAPSGATLSAKEALSKRHAWRGGEAAHGVGAC